MRDVFEVLLILGLCLLLKLFDDRRARRALVANELGRCGSCGAILLPDSDDWVGSYSGRGLWRTCPPCAHSDIRLKRLLSLCLLIAAAGVFALCLL